MRLLIVEDIFETAQIYMKLLEKNGYACDNTKTVKSSIEQLDKINYDIILLDLNLEDANGYELLKYKLSKQIDTPVIVISAINDTDTITKLLNSGADDYITKPVELNILPAKISAVLRRYQKRLDNNIEFGIFELDFTTRTCKIDKEEINLSIKEFDILEVLVKYHDTIVSKEIITNSVYDQYYDSSSTVLRVHLHNLKKKLNNKHEIFQSIQKRGYKVCLNQFIQD